ncbi:MAG: peptidyl-dipeptidase [Acidobacteria bacterium]|nr:MAG: peptidyl-dipeptidase [Acidobacteriota bacterium]
MTRQILLRVAAAAACAAALGCTKAASSASPAGAADAKTFLDTANDTTLKLGVQQAQAGWVQQNFITDDTEAMAARASQAANDAGTRFAKEATKYDKVNVPADERRMLNLLKVGNVLAPPSDPKESDELAKIMARLESTYGRGKWCTDPSKADTCKTVEDVTRILAAPGDEPKLRAAWEGWHTISPPMRKDYQRFVELSNKGARELAFADTGAMWRSKYDMPPDAFTKELDRLWDQVRPLYLKLHAYARLKLHQKYGDVVPPNGPIPAHLLGNIWAQEWGNIYPLVAPPNADPGYSLTEILKKRKMPPLDMVRTGERFYTSLGFAPLPKTFWERSLFVRPKDREVVCHASAWDVDFVEDVRIKMCIEPNAEDFTTIHHELGHDFYQRAYKDQPVLFRDSANDGFHEAIGDSIVLSMTPGYLKQLGLIQNVPNDEHGLIDVQLKDALTRVSFLPFGLLIDKWRWAVFSGAIKPADYNRTWWELRTKYQGVAAPVSRSEDDFDPGAKFHVAANVPYMRYFLARILQFQFHRAMCQAAGFHGPLHECSVYGNKAAGDRLRAMLALGRSKPWPEALQAMTGQRDMDGSALLEYFAPLQKWLKEQNQGQKCGW